MNSKLSESAVIRAFADEICKRLARKIIADLQKMNNGLHSGDDSGLQNIWDEIYEQVQHEQSFFWDAYDQTVRQLVEYEIEKLQCLSPASQARNFLSTIPGVSLGFASLHPSNCVLCQAP